ncbi:carboxymuconolactone decarboxylase family protein [Novosphingobium sp. TH158]|uniref:carboxymuconolactone decarboxylase family protein n=1 Tax=Novosphingobium sp. TH158 TaxID=2067455 RepID=UPI000C7B0E94|nr:carboxymuconolactone decarboxylase family protein [Novosphingobium sp. TH158]PLK24320.1 carboxymuconolactone decarboxylase family protein [Novosphingobium sp. TH158]
MPPRIPPLPREEWTDAARDVFAYWEGDEARQNGSRSNTMMVLAQHPALAMASLDFGKYFMVAATLSGRLQKMIVLRVAHRTGSTYQWTHNALGAQQIGMTPAEVEALASPLEAGQWCPSERAMLRVIDQLLDGGRISDDAWAEASTHFDKRQMLDLVQATGYFTTVAWTLLAAGVEIEPDFAEFSRNRAKAD